MRTRDEADNEEPCYVISVVARKLGVHVQTLRYYEKADIIRPSRSRGNTRLYSERDIARLQHIRMLTEDLGINLAGVEVVLRLMDEMADMQRRIHALEEEVREVRQASSWEE